MRLPLLGLVASALLLSTACNRPPTADEYDQTRGGRIDVFFNDPGSRPGNNWEADVVPIMVDLIDNTQNTLDLATMGYAQDDLQAAVMRAWERGVKVRFVGDAGHLSNPGYQDLLDRHVPMQVGNTQHIMHSKFFISDGRFVFAGTGNWEDSDLYRNWNNFAVIDSPDVAADFTTEFDQMFDGVFGNNKTEVDNPRLYQVGDTSLEVWFAPQEDAMGRILEAVNGAQDSVRFTIFAMTKDTLGSALVRKKEEFAEMDAQDGVDTSGDFTTHRSVAGVIDKSQLHSNGQYHEAYRLLAAGVPLREDGDDDETMPGDYQAGGGRLHSKTMIVDGETDDPTVLTGSFNWSSSATQSNDEFLLVMKSERIAQQYDDYWNLVWDTGRRTGSTRVGEAPAPGADPLAYGDIVINEVMWYGETDQDVDGFDEFLELRNRTDHDIDLSMWQISSANDVVIGFPPGSVIKANALFTILDHRLGAYVDGAPQDTYSAYTNGDMVLNAFNDNRQARLYLKDGAFELHLRDPDGVAMDDAGDGAAAFAGGPSGSKVRSMERNDDPGDGTVASSWHACSLDQGGANVNDAYKATLIATPGEQNSPAR